MQQGLPSFPLILIIEDDQSLSNMYSHKFKLSSFRTIIANDGDTGLMIAQNQKPDIILLDMQLPGKDGEKIARELYSDKNLKDTPIIVLSNQADSKKLEAVKKYGIKEYLLKAMYSPDQVLQIVQKYLGSTS